MPKIGHYAKAIAFANWSVWVKKLKMPRECKKRFYNPIRVVVCKNRSKKDIILKREGILKMAKTGHDAKIKNGKKVQKRFYDHINVVVCKKTAPKNTPNIRKMTAF